MKYNTPREIALVISAVLTGVVGLVFIPILFIEGAELGWLQWLLYGASVLISFLVGYFVVNYSIERFIHRKIRLIYRTIHRLKTQKRPREVDLDFNADVLSEVNKEVVEWAQDNREEIDQLKKQEEFRRDFIGNLSHELKTPIFSIQGYILTLLEGGLEDPTINREYLSRADKNLDRLINMVNELDMITKLESGETHVDRERFDLVELFKEVFNSQEYRAKKRHMTMKFKDPNPKPIYVLGDKAKIEQVLSNLVINSLKYGEEGGKVTVRFYDMDENILTELEDNGMGISSEHLPRLFERFYRVDKSRARHQGGSGLGLAIVKHILDAHNQTINVRSTEGEGTTFSFTLEKA